MNTELDGLFHQVAEALMEGVAIVDGRGQLIFANRALEQLLGYEPGEMAGLPARRLILVIQPMGLQPHLAGEPSGAIRRYEAHLLHRQGGTVPVLGSSCALSAAGDRQGLVLTFTDLRNGGYNSDRVKPPVEMASKSQYVSSVIHELRNALAILTLQSKLLAARNSQQVEQGESLAIIQDQVKRMAHMLESLRSSADPLEPRLETTDINGLIRQTLDLYGHQFEIDGIQVTASLAADLPAIQADPWKLQQVFCNLISNARQAMADGPRAGELLVSTAYQRGDGRRTARLQIRFADNGPGIPPEVMSHLFEPFFTTKGPGQGMGLGLSICDQIVRRHGGRIRAENNTGQGATFVLELPAHGQADEDQEPAAERLPAATPGSSDVDSLILVVDDELSVAQTVEEMLHRAGFQVKTATRAEQALTMLNDDHVDLIVLDLSMPGMNGQQFWQAVRKRHPRLTNRILFSTGDSSGQRWRSFLQGSGCPWIEKPFQADELVRLVHQILQER